MTTARERRITSHAEMAAKAFKDHTITQRLNQGMFRSWRCQAPGTWCYGFDVTTTPGVILITGDLGTLVVECTTDMVAWSRGAINSIDYFAEKVSREIPTDEFDPDVAREFIQESIADEDDAAFDRAERLEKWTALRDELHDECHEHGFYEALRDSGLVDGCNYPNLKNYTPRFLWLREALKWFTGGRAV